MNLTVVNAQEDRANRGRVVMVIVVSLAAAAFFSRQQLIGGVPGVMWALATLGGAFMFAWQSGMLARAHALLRLGAIRREGLAATELLNAATSRARRRRSPRCSSRRARSARSTRCTC